MVCQFGQLFSMWCNSFRVSYKKKKFISDTKHYQWEDPILNKHYAGQIVRNVYRKKRWWVFFNIVRKGRLVDTLALQGRRWRYFNVVFIDQLCLKDAHDFVVACDDCQRSENISRKNEMPLNSKLEKELFDVWGIGFMGPFSSSNSNQYILAAMDYVSKWVEAIAFPSNDAKMVV